MKIGTSVLAPLLRAWTMDMIITMKWWWWRCPWLWRFLHLHYPHDLGFQILFWSMQCNGGGVYGEHWTCSNCWYSWLSRRLLTYSSSEPQCRVKGCWHPVPSTKCPKRCLFLERVLLMILGIIHKNVFITNLTGVVPSTMESSLATRVSWTNWTSLQS